MQTVSDAVRQLLDSYAKVTLSVYVDGGKLDAGVGAGSYTGACAGDDEFSFGNACAAGVNMTLAVARPDLKGRRIQITWAVDGTEYPLITGKVEKAKVTAGRTEIEVWDDMYFAGSKAFAITSTVASTCTAAAAFTAVADAMGVSVEDSALALLSDITIPGGLSELGSDVTNSAVAGYIAGMVGGNALMSRAGSLTIRQYVAVDWETEPYSGGATAENEDFAVTGITLQREKVASTLNEDGSTSERTVSEEYLAGDGSLMLANPLASQEAVDSAFAALSAVTVRPGNYSFPGGLLLEPGDIFTVHSMDGSYAVAVGSISMSFDGGVSSSVACGGAVEDSIDIKGTINQALKALVADYTKFKKLTADNAEINSAHILELLVGDIIADRIKAGIIKSKDGESVVIDLDNGEGTFTGSFQTVSEGSGTFLKRANMIPGSVTTVATNMETGEEISKAYIHHGGCVTESSAGSTAITPADSDPYFDNGGFSHIEDGVGMAYMGTVREKTNEGAKAHAILRNYVDGTRLDLLLQSGRVKITGLTAPVDASDATNKAYVDSNFAPSGYGLGLQTGLTAITSLAQMNATAGNGWYQVSLSGETIGGMHVGTLRVDASPHVIRQTFYGYPAYLTPETIVLVRVWNASLGTWSEWEYVNPPMFIGVEYRTTERWQGKAVYTKLVHIGTLPTAGNVATCAHGASATNMLRCTASTSEGATIPTWFTDKYYGEIGADKNSVFVTAGPSSDYSTITCYARIWYTKD